MPIDDNKKLIFIHVPKTGGSSINEALSLNAIENFFSYKNCIECMPWIKNYFDGIDKNIVLMITPQHLNAYYLEKIMPEKFQNYTKFTIIRNPYDRIVSEFYYINKITRHRLLKDFKNISLLNFLEKIKDLSRILQIAMFDNHLSTQSSMIGNDNNINIFKLENISELFNWLNVKSIHINRSHSRSHYREYFCSQSKKIVEKMYEKDLDNFKYIF